MKSLIARVIDSKKNFETRLHHQGINPEGAD
jgi:hypothetical protein